MVCQNLSRSGVSSDDVPTSCHFWLHLSSIGFVEVCVTCAGLEQFRLLTCSSHLMPDQSIVAAASSGWLKAIASETMLSWFLRSLNWMELAFLGERGPNDCFSDTHSHISELRVSMGAGCGRLSSGPRPGRCTEKVSSGGSGGTSGQSDDAKTYASTIIFFNHI